ncbi:META domain-containing protein [Nonlabens antarcticus]|uniref:META domain-containing protein n=1 Tax=Nonlabens antarcticus TaxID=392714 RepID=UPI0018918EE8|nr:META domain-containing protein [Nonlabens antarcticus]
MKSILSVGLLACLIISITSCDETRKVLDTGSRVELNGTYNVDMLNGKSVSSNQTIVFNGLGKTLSGNAGCNNYNSSFTIENFKLDIGDIALTRKACPEMKMESEFVAALGKVTSYQKTDGTLNLMDANNNVLISAKTAN